MKFMLFCPIVLKLIVFAAMLKAEEKDSAITIEKIGEFDGQVLNIVPAEGATEFEFIVVDLDTKWEVDILVKVAGKDIIKRYGVHSPTVLFSMPFERAKGKVFHFVETVLKSKRGEILAKSLEAEELATSKSGTDPKKVNSAPVVPPQRDPPPPK